MGKNILINLKAFFENVNYKRKIVLIVIIAFTQIYQAIAVLHFVAKQLRFLNTVTIVRAFY